MPNAEISCEEETDDWVRHGVGIGVTAIVDFVSCSFRNLEANARMTAIILI